MVEGTAVPGFYWAEKRLIFKIINGFYVIKRQYDAYLVEIERVYYVVLYLLELKKCEWA